VSKPRPIPLRIPLFMVPVRALLADPSTWPVSFKCIGDELHGQVMVRVWNTGIQEYETTRLITDRQFWLYEHPAPTSHEWRRAKVPTQ
jgi:hypothetical protein